MRAPESWLRSFPALIATFNIQFQLFLPRGLTCGVTPAATPLLRARRHTIHFSRWQELASLIRSELRLVLASILLPNYLALQVRCKARG